ncbi:uncharacterized protein A1O9_11830 [Exophiala aquamarina CBS 119918]|uniref:NmrA-like domain-containing protein n=1 Tax=Exophiala aquamarina CBS 119918 TaxID=1182545 RepID=A0A072NYV8_9EURO|nr:uncharacterized protein A1O9_11830 [Exophiala aquamarina CBS 119918]KEF52203.1 hypothetical protein A1O9_11830 [Exophiala aquamarina CBS 119918]
MVEGQKILIDICEELNVPRYLASDYTADYTKLDGGDIILKDPMKDVRTYLSTRLKVKGIHVLVGLLMEVFWTYFGVWDPEHRKLRYWGTGNEVWDLTTYNTAAEYVAAVILDAKAVGIKRFAGHQVTINRMAEDINVVLGVEPEVECAGSVDEVQQRISLEGGRQNPVA